MRKEGEKRVRNKWEEREGVARGTTSTGDEKETKTELLLANSRVPETVTRPSNRC